PHSRSGGGAVSPQVPERDRAARGAVTAAHDPQGHRAAEDDRDGAGEGHRPRGAPERAGGEEREGQEEHGASPGEEGRDKDESALTGDEHGRPDKTEFDDRR